jgi:hypothetical protein
MYKTKLKPNMKKRKDLSSTQKNFEGGHKPNHSKKHLDIMTKAMKDGFCFQQSHDIAMRTVGK